MLRAFFSNSTAMLRPFSQIRVQRYYFFLKCANFLFLFFLLARRAWGGKKPKKHPSRRIVTLSGPLAVAVSLCNCKQAFIAPTAITITYQGRPIQRRAKTPARAQCRPKKQLLRTKTKTFYVSQQYSRTRNMFFKFGTNWGFCSRGMWWLCKRLRWKGDIFI